MAVKTRAPWRPMDVADVLRGRGSRAPLPSLDDLLAGHELDIDMPGTGSIYVIWQGRTPVLWPMTTHIHDHDCFRA